MNVSIEHHDDRRNFRTGRESWTHLSCAGEDIDDDRDTEDDGEEVCLQRVRVHGDGVCRVFGLCARLTAFG